MSYTGTTRFKVRLSRATALVAIALIGATSVNAATMRFDNGGGTGLWETPANWDSAVPDTLPTALDIADISNAYTASVSTIQPLTELQVGNPNSTPTTVPGTATLNILPFTDIKVSSNNGIRIGRNVLAGSLQAAGSSKGVVIQTGGLLQQQAGTNGLRLSQADAGIVADSLYRISGGSVRGGPTNGTMTAPLQIGAIDRTYLSAEFHMVGSGVTAARFEDIRMQGSTSGTATLHFSLDAGGVTPMIAEDEFRFSYHTSNTGENNHLVVDLIGLAPTSDITLVMADRLTTNGVAGAEIFHGLPDGSIITAEIGPASEHYTYKWTLDYFDPLTGGDNGILDAYVKLVFNERTLTVPEPASLLLLGLGGVSMLLGRRRQD